MTHVDPAPQSYAPISHDREALVRARRRVAALEGFYIHLFVFVAVLAGLLVVNLATGGPWWVQWVLLGWGIGVLAHAIAVMGRTPKFVAEWEKRKTRQFLEQGR